jgi:deoxyadenosine/deoxycytidine kinase
MRIAIDGNMGSGKSTVIAGLAGMLGDATVHPEPVEKWRPLLEKFYADPRSASMDLQMRVLLDFSYIGDDGGLHVVERSPATAKNVFGTLAHVKGWLSETQWGAYKEFDDLVGWTPDAIVFIDTSVDECARRILQRSPPGSAHEPTDIEYLKDVALRYDVLLKFVGVPVVRVDGTKSPGEVLAEVVGAIDMLSGK